MDNPFDRIINRTGTGSVKWELNNSDNSIPLWVADMDFQAPPEVIRALEKRASHGIFGYTFCSENFFEAVIQWFSAVHSWEIRRDWIVFSPGVVPALNMLVQCFSEPGDSVCIQRPVYYPFMKAVKNHGRNIINNPLKNTDRGYVMDYDDLDRKLSDPSVKLMILCNPHNPVARSWRKDELLSLAECCINNNVILISDEIHCDLVFPGHRHQPVAALSEAIAKNTITCTAPSKTFNLAGLQTSNIIISDKDLRKRFKTCMENNGFLGPNCFGAVACETAYRSGFQWYKELLKYLQDNLEILTQTLHKNIPEIKITEHQATYLAWLDFRKLGIPYNDINRLIMERAGVALSEGSIFGPEGEGFQRINIACPKETLEKALYNLTQAFK